MDILLFMNNDNNILMKYLLLVMSRFCLICFY